MHEILSFIILYPYLKKINYFTIMSLVLERGLGDERRVPIKVNAGSLYKNTPLGRIFFNYLFFMI